MKLFLCAFLLVTTPLLAQRPPGGPSASDTAPRPDLFRDPLRKVKNAQGQLVQADLRPLFAWFQHRRGPRPMAKWDRFILTTVQNTPDGVVVSNSLDNKVFFLRNYPYKVPAKSVIHVLAVLDEDYTYKDSSGASQTVHSYDYGVPSTSASERKPAKPAPAKPPSSAPSSPGPPSARESSSN